MQTNFPPIDKKLTYDSLADIGGRDLRAKKAKSRLGLRGGALCDYRIRLQHPSPVFALRLAARGASVVVYEQGLQSGPCCSRGEP